MIKSHAALRSRSLALCAALVAPSTSPYPAPLVRCSPHHPQALAQCDGFIRRLGYQRTAVDDTATAAQQISTKRLKNQGAICSSRAAELYGLEILQAGIQDVKDNVTRFVVLSR